MEAGLEEYPETSAGEVETNRIGELEGLAEEKSEVRSSSRARTRIERLEEEAIGTRRSRRSESGYPRSPGASPAGAGPLARRHRP